jgi:pimeloyl-ACP methyl ester carboxylesterase
MRSGFYPLGLSSLHYTLWGTGHRILFAFHGYGESSATFSFLGEAVGGDFTLIAIDFPCHGDTDWKEDRSFDPGELLAMMADIAAPLPGAADGWWLLGYSMGGRVALQLLELAPEKIRRLVLLAPDGLRVNPWYWLATQTAPGNGLFRWTMRHPGWFFFFLRTANSLRMVNPSVYKFTLHYIDDPAARRLLYTRWTVMRGFRPDLRTIRNIVHRLRIPVQLLYGRFDRVIQSKRGLEFQKRCAPYCQLTVLPAGHQLLQSKFMDIIVSALYLPLI